MANDTMAQEYSKLFLTLNTEDTTLHKYQIKMNQTAKTIQYQKASGGSPWQQPT